MKPLRRKNGSDNVLVVIAALDEEEGIGLTIGELKKTIEDAEILVVDGKSQDRTVEVAKDGGAQVLVQKDDGKGDAIFHALRHLNVPPTYVAFTDADFTYPAEYMHEMIKILDEDSSVGMVCGNRFNSHFHLRSMNNILYFGNRMLAFTHNLLNGVQLRDPLTGLRVVRGEILKDWRPISKGFDIEVELNHLVERKGYDIKEIPINYRMRLGEKKLKIKHAFTILKRILRESIQ